MNIKEYVQHLDLSEGEQYRGNCPVCGGRNTFTATQDTGTLMYNCYKNSCDVGGKIHVGMDVWTIKVMLSNTDETSSLNYETAATDRFMLPEYISPIKPSDSDATAFMRKWHINPDQVLYDVRQDRIVFPVYSHKNILVDAVGRALNKRRQPKWMRYGSSPVPYTHGRSRVGVIVEDAISAYTINDIIPSATGVALLGTQLTEFHKWYLPQMFDSIIVALDPDAMSKTLSIARELRGIVPEVRALKINDDLKYADEDDFYNLREQVSEVA